jgi:hypothetical protein
MGQHKNNLTAKLAKEGNLPPLKPKMGKREMDQRIMSIIQRRFFETIFHGKIKA